MDLVKVKLKYLKTYKFNAVLVMSSLISSPIDIDAFLAQFQDMMNMLMNLVITILPLMLIVGALRTTTKEKKTE